jgi:hypothetical protein
MSEIIIGGGFFRPFGKSLITSHTGLTPADSRCSFAATQSWVSWVDIDLSDYASEGGAYQVFVEDSGGKRANAYLKAIGGGEALDSEILSGAWTNFVGSGYDTLTSVDYDALTAVDDGAALAITYIDNLDFGEGKLVEFSYDLTLNSGTAPTCRVAKDNSLGTSGALLTLNPTPTGANTYYFVNDNDLTRAVGFYNLSTATNYELSSLTTKNVTDCAVTGVHVTTTSDGSTEGWTTIESGFNYNSIVTIEIWR